MAKRGRPSKTQEAENLIREKVMELFSDEDIDTFYFAFITKNNTNHHCHSHNFSWEMLNLDVMKQDIINKHIKDRR